MYHSTCYVLASDSDTVPKQQESIEVRIDGPITMEGHWICPSHEKRLVQTGHRRHCLYECCLRPNLIPLTIASKASGGWKSARIIAMIIIGFICLIVFPLWESSKKLAPHPLIPMYLVKSRTFTAGCGVGFFYFSMNPPDFPSPLLRLLIPLFSGMLSLCPTLLLLLPPRRPARTRYRSRPRHANLLLHFDRRIRHNILRY